jgi:very-short-patch-repair endonuclease
LRYGVDFAWPAAQIAVEVDANETRYLRAAKLNHLALAGWLVLYFTGLMLTTNGPAVIKSVRRALEIKTGQPWPASDGHADRMD